METEAASNQIREFDHLCGEILRLTRQREDMLASVGKGDTFLATVCLLKKKDRDTALRLAYNMKNYATILTELIGDMEQLHLWYDWSADERGCFLTMKQEELQ